MTTLTTAATVDALTDQDYRDIYDELRETGADIRKL